MSLRQSTEILESAQFSLESAANQIKYCVDDFRRGTYSAGVINYINDIVIPLVRVVYIPKAFREFKKALRSEIKRCGGNPKLVK